MTEESRLHRTRTVFAKKLGHGVGTGAGWKTKAVLQTVSVVSGVALAAASAYNRFGVLEAGLESTKNAARPASSTTRSRPGREARQSAADANVAVQVLG